MCCKVICTFVSQVRCFVDVQRRQRCRRGSKGRWRWWRWTLNVKQDDSLWKTDSEDWDLTPDLTWPHLSLPEVRGSGLGPLGGWSQDRFTKWTDVDQFFTGMMCLAAVFNRRFILDSWCFRPCHKESQEISHDALWLSGGFDVTFDFFNFGWILVVFPQSETEWTLLRHRDGGCSLVVNNKTTETTDRLVVMVWFWSCFDRAYFESSSQSVCLGTLQSLKKSVSDFLCSSFRKCRVLGRTVQNPQSSVQSRYWALYSGQQVCLFQVRDLYLACSHFDLGTS